MQFAGWSRQAGKAAAAGAKTPAAAPSWGRVLATTISLWASRRLSGPRRGRRAALAAAICLLVLGAAAVAAVRFSGTSSPAARTSSPTRPHQGRMPSGRPAAGAAAGSSGLMGSVRPLAAAWIAGQVGGDETIACDPLMCAALAAHGVAASRLLPLGPPSSGAPGTDLIVASPSARPGLSQDAPALLASFGSGASQIEVRAAFPGGAAAYQSAVRADLAARRSAGTQLLHSRRVAAGVQQAAQLEAGTVDTRLLIMLAMLASQHPLRVVAFGDASPGVPSAQAPFRQAIIASVQSRAGVAALAWALAMVQAQQAPYQPARVTTVRLAGGQAGLLIDFAAPGPLGLLTGGAAG